MSWTDLILPQLAKKRLDQVELEGRSRTVLKRLQRKAGEHAKLRSWLKSHITGLTHVVDVDSYLRNEQHGDQKGPLRKIIWKMDQEVSSGLARIEQNIRESLQIEIAWISISEATSIKRLTWITRSCVVLLDPVRTVDWATKNGKELQKELKNQCHRDAVLLQTQGEVASELCSQCARNGGVFQSCVSAPEMSNVDGKRHGLFAGGCANCIWHSKGAQCEFYGGKSAHWDSEMDMTVLQQGGLRALDDGNHVKDWPSSDDPLITLNARGRLRAIESDHSSSEDEAPALGSMLSLPLSTMSPRVSPPPAASPDPASSPLAASPGPGSPLASGLRSEGSLGPLPPLGALTPLSPAAREADTLPAVPCRRCLKEALRTGVRLKKPCVWVPLQCRCRAAAGLRRHLQTGTRKGENEGVHMMQSLNRNVFCLLGVMSAMAGVFAPAPEEEEVEVVLFEGDVI
ncbi:hypothetical protein IFM61606_06513 [Aspergillus udagawae]|nr:hypothetical protein IFM61606_06513 [Aspergillus udagawae]